MDLQILKDIGLNESEIKVYTTLLKVPGYNSYKNNQELRPAQNPHIRYPGETP
jgi:hypothetical protein